MRVSLAVGGGGGGGDYVHGSELREAHQGWTVSVGWAAEFGF